jgi:hypothetical protein
MKIANTQGNTSRYFGMLLLLVLFIIPSRFLAQISLNVTTVNPTCAGFTNGSATVQVSGGTAPYSYIWSNGSTAATAANLNSGNYSVTVTDATGRTANAITSITPPPPLSLTATCTNPCQNGVVTANATGGTTPYTYTWSNGATGANQTLPTGNYFVTVTDANGCGTTRYVPVVATLTVRINVQGLRCFGDCDASVEAIIQGGAAPFTFRWNNGATTQVVPNLPAGTYSVTVTDANGCAINASATVNNPTEIAINTRVNAPSCGGGANGTATAIASGGAGNFTYQWSNGQTGSVANNLAVGTYTVTATDGANCTQVARVEVPASGNFALVATPQNAACGAANGSVSVSVLGGTAPFNFLWNTGATTPSVTGLVAGTYRVTVTDGAGCSNFAAATVNSTGGFTVNMEKTDASCGIANGQAKAIASAGRAPFTYLWNNGASTQTISGLAAGTYTVTVTDADNCTIINNVTILQNRNLVLQTNVTQPICNGERGSASVTVMGGSSPYTYAWSSGSNQASVSNLTAGTYTIMVTDVNGCSGSTSVTITNPTALTITATSTNATCNAANGTATTTASGGTGTLTYRWSNGATTPSVSGLSAGSYSVVVTDANGCTAETNVQITGSNNAITVNANGQNATCGLSNGTATLTISGGVAPYTYLWSNGATTQNLSNLAAGTYTATVTDNAGCIGNASVTISGIGSPSVSGNVTNVRCNGGANGSISLSVSNGTTPYRFAWLGDNGFTANTQQINDLSAGNYRVTITDANNCQTVNQFTVNQPAAISVTLQPTNTTCGLQNGAIAATVSGGTGALTYRWNNGATTPSVSNLVAGNYTLTVTDNNACTVSANSSVAASLALAATITPTHVTCNGGNNGGISINITQGTAPFRYSWSNNTNSANLSNLVAGNYTVSITDINNCSIILSTTITEPTPIAISISPIATTCGLNNGRINIGVTGGVSSYRFAWTNSATTQNLNNLTTGNYTVTVTDANNCTATAQTSIGASLPISIGVNTQNVLCNGASTGSATVSITNGTPPFRYSWSNGTSADTARNLAAATYGVTVTDANNCTASKSFTISQPTAISLQTSSTNATCSPIGTATATASGGVGNIAFAWSNGRTTTSITNLAAGTYTVTATDQNRCTKTASVIVDATTSPNLSCNITITTPITTATASEGALNVAATNGRAPYRYLWSNNATTQAIQFLPAGVYRVTVTDALDCQTTCNITLVDPPCDNLTFAGSIQGDETICPNVSPSDITETAPASGGSGVIEYMWMRGTRDVVFNTSDFSPIPNSNTPDLRNIAPLTETTYFIRCTRRVGCPFIETNRVTKTVSINGTYTAPRFGCQGRQLNFTAADNGANTTYTWNFGASATPSTFIGREAFVTFSAAGTYWVRLDFYKNGCLLTQMIPLTINNCASGGGSILRQFTASVVSSQAVALNWATENETLQSRYYVERSPDGKEFKTIGEVGAQNGQFNTYRYTDQFPKRGHAFYRLRNVNQLGESNISAMRQVMIYSEDKEVLTYPNPTDAMAFVEMLDDSQTQDATFDLYDIQGTKVLSNKIAQNVTRFEINLADLPNGVYFLHLRLANGQSRKTTVTKFNK